jgi:4-carboxymuconolactone decarboxylase
MNKDMYDKGLAVRRAVLGDAYVDKAINSADDFNRPLQELVTEYCWGAV